MPSSQYTSDFTGQHNDEYDERITSLLNTVQEQQQTITSLTNRIITLEESNAKLINFNNTHRVLLWSTTSQDVGPTTIYLDFTPYDQIEIEVYALNRTMKRNILCDIGTEETPRESNISVFNLSKDNTTNASTFINTFSRRLFVYSNRIVFENGQMTYVGNAYVDWSGRAIPSAIYGIKYWKK